MKLERSGALIISRPCAYFSLGPVFGDQRAALGRPTDHVPDPDSPQEILEAEVLETQPMVVQTLVYEKFRAVDVSSDDSVSVARGHEGDLRAWGSFRVSLVSFGLQRCDPKL